MDRGTISQLVNMVISNIPHVISGDTSQMQQIHIVPPESDNEMIFEILLTLLVDVVTRAGYQSLQHMAQTDISYALILGRAFALVGYNFKIDIISKEESIKIVPYSYITSSGMILNKFHPFRLMEHMNPPPPIYTSFFYEKTYLPNLFALQQIDDNSYISVRFQEIRLHFSGSES